MVARDGKLMVNLNFFKMYDIINDQIRSSIDRHNQLLENKQVLWDIEKATLLIINALKGNKKIMVAGNGGSAADSQHIAAEFVNRFYFDRPGLPAIALTTDTSVITSIGNDYGFENVFSRQIESIGSKGDVFIGISTSGNSANIIKAFTACRNKKIFSVGLTGNGNTKMKDLCDVCLMVPSDETARIQEMHILIAHIICYIAEEQIFGKLNGKK